MRNKYVHIDKKTKLKEKKNQLFFNCKSMLGDSSQNREEKSNRSEMKSKISFISLKTHIFHKFYNYNE